jgi:hypothetical protein
MIEARISSDLDIGDLQALPNDHSDPASLPRRQIQVDAAQDSRKGHSSPLSLNVLCYISGNTQSYQEDAAHLT